jgi:hypothetical protein
MAFLYSREHNFPCHISKGIQGPRAQGGEAVQVEPAFFSPWITSPYFARLRCGFKFTFILYVQEARGIVIGVVAGSILGKHTVE